MNSYSLNSRVTVAVALTAMLALPAAAQTIAITGGKVYPVSGPPIENGTVIITNGRITAVGANVAVPAGAHHARGAGAPTWRTSRRPARAAPLGCGALSGPRFPGR